MVVGFLDFKKEHANIVLKEFAKNVNYAECKFVWLLRTEKSKGFISYLNILGMDPKTKIPIPDKIPIHVKLNSIPKCERDVWDELENTRDHFPHDAEESCWIRPRGRESVIEKKKKGLKSVIEKKKKRVTFALDPDLAAAADEKNRIDRVNANTIERKIDTADITNDLSNFRLG